MDATGTSLTAETPLICTTGTSSLSDSPLLVRRIHDVPGEVWIEPHEREGLPVGPTPLGESLDLGVDPDRNVPNPSENGGGKVSRSTTLFSGVRGSNDGNIVRRLSTRHNTHAIDQGAEKHIEKLAARHAAGVVRAHTRKGSYWLHHPHVRSGGHGNGSDTDSDEKPLRQKSGRGKRRYLSHSDLDLVAPDGASTEQEVHAISKNRRRGNKKVNKSAPSWLYSFVNRTNHSHPSGDVDRHDPELQEGSSEFMHAPHAHPRLGKGILSTLLALYGNDYEQERAGELSEEGSVSGGSAPLPISGTSSRAGSEGDHEEPMLGKPVRPCINCPKNSKGKCFGQS